MNKIDKAWLACAIDGEGTIVFGKRGGKRHNNLVTVAIYNTNRNFLENCQRIAKTGQIRLIHPHRENEKQYFHFVIWKHTPILQLLKEILPFLIIKKLEAEKAIRLIEEHQWRLTLKYPETKRHHDIKEFIYKQAREGFTLRAIAKMTKEKFGLDMDPSGSTVLNILRKQGKNIIRRCHKCGNKFIPNQKHRLYCPKHYRGLK